MCCAQQLPAVPICQFFPIAHFLDIYLAIRRADHRQAAFLKLAFFTILIEVFYNDSKLPTELRFR